MKLVKHLLEAKGSDIISIQPDASVLDAIKLMAEKGIGSLVVTEGEALKGIVTERDYARKVIIKGRASDSTRISEIMTADPPGPAGASYTARAWGPFFPARSTTSWSRNRAAC